MFISNPWAVYAWILTGTLLIYYIFVGWKYFRTDIRNLLGGRAKKRQFSSEIPTKETQSASDRSRQDLEVLQEQQQTTWQNQEAPAAALQNLFEHLTTEIEDAHQKNYHKQDLIQMLQMILKDYPAYEGSQFQFAVNDHIDTECAKYGSIHLSEGDKDQVWRVM